MRRFKKDVLERIAPLLPVDFFSFGFSIPRVKKPFENLAVLPDMAALLSEEGFAKVLMGWSDDGVYVELRASVPFTDCFYPGYDQGDSLELFFDTRDVKSAGFATRFCHHFVALPEPILGIQVQEVSHFRSEDAHPLCDPSLIELEAEFGKHSYQMRLFFPRDALHGFDPNVIDRLGFTYKVNRAGGKPMHFSTSTHNLKLSQQPSLWASLQLEK